MIEAAKLTHRLNDGRIVVLQNRSTDAYSADRLASLTNPLKAAGLKYEITPVRRGCQRGERGPDEVAGGPAQDRNRPGGG